MNRLTIISRAPSRKGGRPGVVTALICAAALGLSLLAGACAGPGQKPAGFARGITALPVPEWGVEILGVRRSSNGYMLDFRMRVTDAEKALPLFVRKTKPVLIDEKSGQKLAVASTAKSGPLRSSNRPQNGRNYPIIFNNAQKIILPGSLVTVVIGEFKVEHLEVR